MEKRLRKRSKVILREIVRGYICSAEPMGSRTISKSCNFDLSPASIRNEMADLEEMGYITQLHISSGRIPTDKGYRFYVNEVIHGISPSKEDIEKINKSYGPFVNDRECIFTYTSMVLSKMSNYAGIVLVHKLPKTVLKHIKFIRLNQTRVLAVFVTGTGLIQNKIVDIGCDISQDSLDSISQYLNKKFNGYSLERIRNVMLGKMKKDKERYNNLLQSTIDLIKKAFITDSDEEIYVEGTLNMFDHPDFVSDMGKLKTLLRAFEEKKNLVKILDGCLDQEGISIIIGDEAEENDMECCSLITHTFSKDDSILGVLGIIGPKRMEYSKIIPMVNYTAQLVNNILSGRELLKGSCK